MLSSYIRTHHFPLSMLISIAVTLLLIYLFPTSYGIYSVNLVKDTPLSHMLPVLFGILSAVTIHPTAPAMEHTAPSSLLRIRALLTITTMILQLLILLVIIGIMNPLLQLGITHRDIIIYIHATLFWQGLCCLTATFTSTLKAWILPGLIFMALLIYSWDETETPVPWNMLLSITPITITATALALILGILALFYIDPHRQPKLKQF